MKRKMLNIFLYPIVALVLVYLFLRWFERANVWIPSRNVIATPEVVDLEYEDVFFDTEDGVKLHAWYVSGVKPAAALLFCHGNGGNLSYRTESLRQFHSIDLNVFIFDYRGYGKSEGRVTEEGTYKDAMAAYNWLKQREPDLPIVIFGRSLGSAVAVDLALKVPAAALICESGFTSIPDMAKVLFPFLPIDLIGTIKYDTQSKMPSLKMPVLVVHGQDDELIPYKYGQALFDSAPEPKEFITLIGGHNDGFILSESFYLAGIKTFLDKHLPKP